MSQINDSEATRADRTLPQHQAALTLAQSRLSAPSLSEFRWLDLACGRGQIIRFLDRNLSSTARSKIEYVGFDISSEYARETAQLAEGLGFRGQSLEVGELSKFKRIVGSDRTFDFITLTNTVHEVQPDALSRILLDGIISLTSEGVMFIYDMERISPPELGAVPWTRDEVQRIVFSLLENLGCRVYRPEVSQWTHRTVNGWNLQIDRRYIDVDQNSLHANMDQAQKATTDVIRDILAKRLRACVAALEAVTKYGAQTADEENTKDALLYEFWATSRALEVSQ